MKKVLLILFCFLFIFSSCKKEKIEGCTNPLATNYDSDAEEDDGSCILTVLGCTDANAVNYDPNANTDDGSCIDPMLGCTDSLAMNYNPNATNDDGSCNYSIIGTWELIDYIIVVINGYIDPALLTETVLETETNTMNTDPINLFWVYRDNGTFSEYQYDNDIMSHYQHYDYVKNGDEVSMMYGPVADPFMTWTVTSLTSSNLNMNYENENFYEDFNDTISFTRQTVHAYFIKSQLPSITTEPLSKNKPVSGYNSFLNRREIDSD